MPAGITTNNTIMHNQQKFQSEQNGPCGSRGRGNVGGPWGRGKFAGFRSRYMGNAQPPVNIDETNDAYTISLFAAGITKERVRLTVKDDVLTVAYQPDNQSGPDAPTGSTYQEHRQGAFERQFRLNDKVLTDQISASYTDGILRVTLPKNPETNKPVQTIAVA